MRTQLTAIVLAGLVWGCDAKASAGASAPPPQAVKVEGPSYTTTVKIDDV